MIQSWRHIQLGCCAFFCALLASCGQDVAKAPQAAQKALRIVSLDYCADQFVLKLVDKDRIMAVSKDAESSFSYMRETAKGVRQVRASLEDVLALKPDLVVRSYGGGPNVSTFLERAGVPVLNVGWASDIPAVKHVIQTMADGLGESARGKAVVADMDARLNAIRTSPAQVSTLYMTPSGATSGPGSLVHDMLVAAGLENYLEAPGWRPLPLEQLVRQPPDMIAAAFFEAKTNHKSGWSPTRHPVAKQQLANKPTVFLEGAWTSCSGWYLLDAVEALALGRPVA